MIKPGEKLNPEEVLTIHTFN